MSVGTDSMSQNVQIGRSSVGGLVLSETAV